MPCHAMHPIQDLFLESFSYALQFDMHFICTPMWTKNFILIKSGCYIAFRLPHALHIGRQFSESSGTSNTLLSLRFGILFLLCLILLGLLMLILWGVGLTERALLKLAIFSDLLLYVGRLASSLLLHSSPQRPSL
jgi:hypothetical protein